MIHTDGNSIFSFPEQLFSGAVWDVIYDAFFDIFQRMRDTYICFGSESFSVLALFIGGSCISAVLAIIGFSGKDDFGGVESDYFDDKGE